MQGEILFVFVLLSSPLPFPTPLSVTLSRIAWLRSRALKCIWCTGSHKRAEVLLHLSCWHWDTCAASTHTFFAVSAFGVKLHNPFPDKRISRCGSHIDLIMIRELGEVCGNGHVRFFLFFLQLEKHHKMIIFFSSCEQVEFHYELLLNVLSGGLESEQPEHSSVSFAHLQFLRLHGNMEQEVSILKMSGYAVLFLIPYDLLCGYFGEEGRREDRESFHL